MFHMSYGHPKPHYVLTTIKNVFDIKCINHYY